MKLRNKKTGLTGKLTNIDLDIYEDDNTEIDISILVDNSGGECIDKQFYSLDEFKKFLEDWKEVKEPIIKDPKIRKAVRAWAEANEVAKVYVYGIGDGKEYLELYEQDNGMSRISIKTQDGIWFGKVYTVTELCGEEKE